MGDHRATIKIEFTMHGVTTTREMWINWFPGAELPSPVADAFLEAEVASMRAYWDAEDKAEDEMKAKRKAVVDQARSKLTDEEWNAIRKKG